jgi:hypothetical protein
MKNIIVVIVVVLIATSAAFSQGGLPSPSSEDNSGVLLFPTVVDNIFDGKFSEVPDDQLFRIYLVSVYKGIYDQCNPNGNGIGLAAGAYGFPQFRQLEKTGHMGTGNIWGMLSDYSKNQSPSAIAGSVESIPQFYDPGYEDGIAIAQTYKCNSVAVRGLKIKFSELFEARKEALPERDDIERWQRLMHPSWRPILGKKTPSVGSSSAALAEEAELYELIKNHTNKESHNLQVSSRGLNTTINVKKGDIIEVRATGYISVGLFAGSSSPAGIDGFTAYNRVSGFKHGALLVSVGGSNWKGINQDMIFRAEKSGEVTFLVNDAEPQNNRGAYSVELHHYQF